MSPSSWGGWVEILSTSIQCSVQSLWKHVLWIVTALGTSCWPLPLSPFLFGVVCTAEARWSQFVLCYYGVFSLTSPSPSASPFFSLSQVMFQVGWQSTARSHRQSRKFVSSVQKHVLTVCATSGGLFTLKAILFCGHMTQCSWRALFWHPEIAKQFKQMKEKKREKKKRSTSAIVSRMLLREVLAPAKEQSGAIFSYPGQKQKVTLWQL